MLKHLYEKYGETDLVDYLKKVTRNVYSPLIEELQKEGKCTQEFWKKSEVFSYK
jgi:hypothetical protein